MPTKTGEEIWEVTLLEDHPELGLHAGDKCGLPKSIAAPLVTPAPVAGQTVAAKAKVHRMGL